MEYSDTPGNFNVLWCSEKLYGPYRGSGERALIITLIDCTSTNFYDHPLIPAAT